MSVADTGAQRAAGAGLARPVAAEALGTGLLLAVIVGSGVMAERLAAGNDAVALLANTAATAAGLVVLISLFGPVSGAHFNPAVTLMMLLGRKIEAGVAAAYVTAQVGGGIAGVWLTHLMFAEPVLQVSTKMREGPPQILSEAVATFGLLLVIQGGARHRPEAVPALVGLYIGAAYWFTASTSFANPAVTVARMLSDSFAGIAPASAPGFLVGQCVGLIAAVAVGRWFFPGDNR